MNKFRGPDDDKFILISGALKETFDTYRVAQRRSKRELKCLQCLSSNYREYKDRNPQRVARTCKWFLKHPKFRAWYQHEIANLLWVSADPGCGKSVLAKALVDEGLLGSNHRHPSVCYIFFKDDNDDQKTSAQAIRAILHQLFIQKPALLTYAMDQYHNFGDNLSSKFTTLWDILIQATADPKAGQIIWVLDALDEYRDSDRFNLIEATKKFYLNVSRDEGTKIKLKFLLTSRSYVDIERRFRQLTKEIPTIRLSAEEQIEPIRGEINRVIEHKISELKSELELDDSLSSLIKTEISKITHRTYLWLHLTFEEIRDSIGFTKSKLQKIVSTLPDIVENAYQVILDKRKDTKRTKKLLHIIALAARPLTLEEISIALVVQRYHKSCDDLDLENEAKQKEIIRNLCDLFINIIDGKVYLIHQTAKEYLVWKYAKLDPSRMGIWKHSLVPRESNLIIVKSCI